MSLAEKSDYIPTQLTEENRGLYRSDDGGRSWARIAPDLGDAIVKVDSSGTVYVANYEGLFRSYDKGENFERVADGNVTGLDIVNDNVYYLICDSGAVDFSAVFSIKNGNEEMIAELVNGDAAECQHKYYVAESGLRVFYEGELPAEAPEGAETGTVTGGVITGGNSEYGGGVYADGGTFTMSGGTISGNTASSYGGGVYVCGGTFTMIGGTITGNTSYAGGGDVHMNDGKFTMNGGYLGDRIVDRGTVSISGGYFAEEFDTAYLAENCGLHDISAFGTALDSDYKDGFPYAVYENGTAQITANAGIINIRRLSRDGGHRLYGYWCGRR